MEEEVKIFDASWIRDGITTKAISFARWFGKKLADERLTNTQIRNIFGEVKVIESLGYKNAKTRFLLLGPKIAYTTKRQGGRGANANQLTGMDRFHAVFIEAYHAVSGTDVEQEARFARFVDFMEAFLAYHRYFS